jgi:serine/threonine-protein kinase RsbT
MDAVSLLRHLSLACSGQAPVCAEIAGIMAASDTSCEDLVSRLRARVVVVPAAGAARCASACCATSISEALHDAAPGCALVIPLGNAQVVAAAALLGARAVVVCGGAAVEPEAADRARQEGLTLLATALDLAACRARLAGVGEDPVAVAGECLAASGETRAEAVFPVLGGGYFMAGYASRRVRDALEAAGVKADVVRRVSIATYEAEMNVVIYAPSGSVSLCVTRTEIQVCVTDNGPGIGDLEQAMRPGYSTAPPKARAMGFGAGMGLPNMARCCDDVSIETGPEAGGTRVLMRFRRGQN